MFLTLMNPQSKGTVSIASADPTVPPVIDPNYLASPFDRAALKEATRETLRIIDTPYLKQYIKHPILAPSSTNDEDIEASIYPLKNMPSYSLIYARCKGIYSLCWHGPLPPQLYSQNGYN